MNTDTDINTTSKAADLAEFLKSVELLSRRLEAANFQGVNGAEVMREGREERGCYAGAAECAMDRQFTKLEEQNTP